MNQDTQMLEQAEKPWDTLRLEQHGQLVLQQQQLAELVAQLLAEDRGYALGICSAHTRRRWLRGSGGKRRPQRPTEVKGDETDATATRTGLDGLPGAAPRTPAVAQEGLQSAVPSPSATKTGSRDQQLLDSLGPAPSRAGASSPSAARGQPAGSGETGNVREPRGAGSDVGPSSPLVRIEQRMRHVEQRLRQRQTGEETQGAQREIERQLDELISQLADSLPSATACQPDSVPRKDQPTSVTGDRPAREGVSQRDENGVSALVQPRRHGRLRKSGATCRSSCAVTCRVSRASSSCRNTGS